MAGLGRGLEALLSESNQKAELEGIHDTGRDLIRRSLEAKRAKTVNADQPHITANVGANGEVQDSTNSSSSNSNGTTQETATQNAPSTPPDLRRASRVSKETPSPAAIAASLAASFASWPQNTPPGTTESAPNVEVNGVAVNPADSAQSVAPQKMPAASASSTSAANQSTTRIYGSAFASAAASASSSSTAAAATATANATAVGHTTAGNTSNRVHQFLQHSTSNVSDSNVVYQILLSKLQPSRYQPRQEFSQTTLLGLADSIKRHGILEPLIVRRLSTGGYEILCGERRYRAAKLAGLKIVPCIVREVDDDQAYVVALIENVQRENLNPLEMAQAMEQMIKVCAMTQEEVAKAVGKSRPTVTNLLRLLNLTPEVQELLRTGEIDGGHARALLALHDSSLQQYAAHVVVNNKLSVRATEDYVRELNANEDAANAVKAMAELPADSTASKSQEAAPATTAASAPSDGGGELDDSSVYEQADAAAPSGDGDAATATPVATPDLAAAAITAEPEPTGGIVARRSPRQNTKINQPRFAAYEQQLHKLLPQVKVKFAPTSKEKGRVTFSYANEEGLAAILELLGIDTDTVQ